MFRLEEAGAVCENLLCPGYCLKARTPRATCHLLYPQVAQRVWTQKCGQVAGGWSLSFQL